MKTLALLLSLISYSAHAETWGTIGFSRHTKDKEYCEVHPGVVREWRTGNWRLFIGAHQNSYCQASAVAGAAWLPIRYAKLSAGLVGMGVTGYDESPVLPAGGPAVSYDEKKHGADLIWIPDKVLFLRWRWSFE